MKKINQIENIEPYNELWYESCWYNALFPVILRFGRPIQPFLAKDVFYYDKKDGALTYSLFRTRSNNDVLKELGVDCQSEIFCRHLRQRIINAVDRGRCVIFAIDPFLRTSSSGILSSPSLPPFSAGIRI